jgi:anti-sigma B factor antagonist
VRDQWFEFLDGEQPKKLVVSFDEVRIFGSEAVGVLIRVAKRVRSDGGDVKLCSMSSRIREIFDICRLVPAVFEVYHSAGEAIDAFA